MQTVAVSAAEAITDLAQARHYYASKLVRAHQITCHGAPVVIVFEAENTHLFSEEVEDTDAIPADQLVTKKQSGGREEIRQFSLDRARLMDCVLPAITSFTHCHAGAGPPTHSTRLMYGKAMPCGRHMCVVLRPGPKTAWTVVTSFPMQKAKYSERCRMKPTRFPVARTTGEN
ncbi:MAG TPA: hypothetical protein VGI12_02785 [Vicinamibacterales bacterium]|jgi:hypothetical protein